MHRVARGKRLAIVGTAITLAYLGVFIALPFAGVVGAGLQQGLPKFVEQISSPETLQALAISLSVVLAALPLSVVFGIAAAWLLARFRFPGRRAILTIINLPLSLSPVIVGLMFVLLLGSNSVLGGILESAGFRVIFAWPSLLLVSLFISLPYMVREVLPVLEDLGTEDEEAAMSLGAGGFTTFWKITLPNIRLAVLYGITLSSARILGEYGATAVVSGLLRGVTVTLPIQVQIYYSEYMTTAAFASATIFLVFGFVTLVAKKRLELKMNDFREAA